MDQALNAVNEMVFEQEVSCIMLNMPTSDEMRTTIQANIDHKSEEERKQLEFNDTVVKKNIKQSVIQNLNTILKVVESCKDFTNRTVTILLVYKNCGYEQLYPMLYPSVPASYEGNRVPGPKEAELVFKAIQAELKKKGYIVEYSPSDNSFDSSNNHFLFNILLHLY